MKLVRRGSGSRAEAIAPLLGFPDSVSTRQMARALGALFVAGASITLTWVALPHTSRAGDPWTRMAAVVGLVAAAALLAGAADRSPRVFFHVVIGGIQIFATVAFVATSPDMEFLLFYTWVTPYAALFFGRRAAAAHVAWVGALLAAGLELRSVPAGRAVAIWLLTIGTVTVIATLVGVVARAMRRRDSDLSHLATHDVLTDLPNRRMFAQHAAAAISDRQVGGSVAVLLIDLDRFKVINDTHGHQAGDEMLAQLAPRLRNTVRDEDWVGRFGGDEFAILVRREGRFDATAMAARVAEAWALPLPTSEGLLFTSACVGIAVASRFDDTPQRLLRDADSALYRAKAMGPGSFQVFDEQMRDGAEHRLRLEQDLREAIPRDQLHLIYQPVVDMVTDAVSSVEALLRWTHPELGEVPPNTFIPLAEESALIAPIGAWVIERAAWQLAAWRIADCLPPDFSIAVNVSSMQLRDGFAASVAEVLDRHSLPSTALIVELTESSLIDARDEVTREIQRLRDLGIRLLLDDFGTGYSSLSYLQNIPLDGLKIDQSFIARISDTTDAPIVEAIITMARTLGLHTVAEGVETPAQRDRLRALGCDLAQGYLFARPAPAEEIEGMLKPLPAASEA
ncbi:MAG: EAL domain-containing protein [Actinomycetota bacterium]